MARGMLTLAAVLVLWGAPVAGAADFTVNATADAVDTSAGDGTCAAASGACTLRAAVQEADAASGASTITVPAGRYRLTIPASPEAGSAGDSDAGNGDLDLNADITVRGAGVGRTIVDGGGVDRVFETGAQVTTAISDMTITGGDSTANDSQEIDLGGGIFNKSGITLKRVELIANKADGGGGMFSIPGTMPVIRDSLITHNQAFAGGGLRIDHGAMIVNTTITANTLRKQEPGDKPVGVTIPTVDEISGYGGGIDHRGGADLTIVNSTITDNHALKGGGGIGAGQGYAPLSDQAPLGRVILRNTIVAGNTSVAGAPNCRTNQVLFASAGHNIDTDGSCFLAGPGDLPRTDPLLRPLADHGGPTRTLAPRRGSPAIDAGDATDCPRTDQRGIARPQGAACDIGAFERVTPCTRVVRLPARLRRRARAFRVHGVAHRPRQRVVVTARKVKVRVRLRSGRTLRRTLRSRCRR